MHKKKIYSLPYINNIDEHDSAYLYGLKGEPIVVLQIKNPVVEFSANINEYNEAHEIFNNIIKIVSEETVIHKTDIFYYTTYEPEIENNILRQEFQSHFLGRKKKHLKTFLSITINKVTDKKIFKYSEKVDIEFKDNLKTVIKLLSDKNLFIKQLNAKEIDDNVKRILGLEFDDNIVVENKNMNIKESYFRIGETYSRAITIIDTENMKVPDIVSDVELVGEVSSSKYSQYPIDSFNFFSSIENYKSLIYNQIIVKPTQKKLVEQLNKKKRQTKSIPDAENNLTGEEIENALYEVNKYNQILTYSHFNVIVEAEHYETLEDITNQIKNYLFEKGFYISRNIFNQKELFETSFFGGGNILNTEQYFISSSDASITFFFFERFIEGDISNHYVYFTDRRGIPIKLDPDEIHMEKGIIDNRNMVVLGGSGTGKSFTVNTLLSQLLEYDIDIVIIDTGDSYIGMCDTFEGKYIKHTSDNPISMNPFNVTKEEWEKNKLDKLDFLTNLILIIFEDRDSSSKETSDIIEEVINEYYYRKFFHNQNWYEDKDDNQLIKYIKEYSQVEYNFDETSENKYQQNTDKMIESIKEYRAILDVDEDMSISEIQKIYRKKIKEVHPDKGGTEEEFRKYNTAFNKIIEYEKQNQKYYNDRKSLIKIIKDIDEDLSINELSFNSFYEFSVKFIPIISKVNSIKFELDTYKYLLKKFYKGGRYESILNDDTQKGLFDEKLIVFEVDNIKDNPKIFPIVTLIIMDSFIQKMHLKKHRRKAMVIEEAWKAILDPRMSKFILYLYKTVRKYWGQCIVVTQELNDIISSPLLQESIIANSDKLLLLDQAKNIQKMDKLQQVFGLSDSEISKILTIHKVNIGEKNRKFKEFYFSLKKKGNVYANEVSLFQYLCFTTEKVEKNAVEIYIKRYGNYEIGIKKMIDDFKSKNISLKNFCTLTIQNAL